MKKALRDEFNTWYTERVIDWVKSGKEVKDFKCDTRWSLIKPLNAKWICNAYEKITKEDIISSFNSVGL
jgi:hypothetical protein